MTKKHYYYIAFITALFAVAFTYDSFMQQGANINSYSTTIEEYLHQQEALAESFFEEKAYIKRQLTGDQSPQSPFWEKDITYLDQLTHEEFTLTIHQEDSLAFWTNNLAAFPAKKYLSLNNAERTYRFVALKNGFFELIQQVYRDPEIGQYTISALIPIKHQYELESNYLGNYFTADKKIPTRFELVQEPNDYSIKNNQGQILSYLSADATIIDKSRLQISFSLYLLAFVFLIILFNSIARYMIKLGQLWQGAAFLIISIFGTRFASVFLGFSDKFSDLSIFATENFDTPLSTSLGDLLINIILLLWIMAFFHKEFPVRPYRGLSLNIRFGVTILNYIAILAAILLLTSVFKTLVFNTGLTFDFDNVFSLDTHSLLAIFGVILLLIALFLFSHRMMMTIAQINLGRYERLLSLGIATLVCLPFLFKINLIIHPVYLLFIGFAYILIFDQFIDRKQVNFTWLLIWLVILSAFPSVLLFKYNAHNDFNIRNAYARELANTEDIVAENALSDFHTQLIKDTLFTNSSMTFPIEEKVIKKQIDKYYLENNYLFYNYDYQVYGFDPLQQSLVTNQTQDWNSSELRLESSAPTNEDHLKFWSDEKGYYAYLMPIPWKNKVNGDISSLVLEFKRKRREQSKVFTELLSAEPYKNLDKLSKYDYAIYKHRNRIDSEGKVYGPLLNTEDLPEAKTVVEEKVYNRSELIYNAGDDVVVIIGKEQEDHLKKAISLFSFIFSMLLAFVLIFAIINYIVKILPDSLNFFLPPKPSLKNRVQYSVIALILVSFIFIGVVTVWFFRSSSNDYHENRLERKTSSVKLEAIHDLEMLAKVHELEILNKIQNQGELTKPEDSVLSQPSKLNLAELDLVNPLSKIHRLDVNLYDLSGGLISSSEDDVFNKGILSRQMIAPAFHALSRRGLPEYIQEEEKIGTLNYKTAYIPLQIKDKTIAYMGLPYYSKQSKLRSDVTVFMSTLINVYVFLLLIAGGFSIFVANSITRPIAVIGEKLKQFKLGKRNEPLEWKTPDEIGTLIAEYNRMIKKLAESADRLAQSEREGAWREMAKQVAHEIKNPLTPMKLSIQYLQHAYRSNPDNVEPLLKRVSSTLIEQIDNLAQIASEFSNLAKMPRAENQKINLNALTTSVYDLFHEGEKMEISLNLPLEELMVYADKNHLIRVLTNLIKNAQQAIPEDRLGKISISLYRNDELATILVKDNGTGIPEDKQHKVFVPNFTTKSSGTGLGLAISKSIIESVNGEIYFKTEVGTGTDFYVKLPIVEVAELEKVEE